MRRVKKSAETAEIKGVRAVILAGGRGTRLRPYTTVLPKPLVPVGDRPILELILHQLRSEGYRRVDLCVGHLSGLIEAYFADGRHLPDGLELCYHHEDQPLGTAGALHGIEDLTDSFLVMNGDILTTLRYSELMYFHRSSHAALTIATYRKSVKFDLGVVEHEGAVVTGFKEKPTIEAPVSMGIYVYEPSVLGHIPHDRFDFPDVVQALLAAGERVVAYPFDGAWFDIGTLGDHELATSEIERTPELFGSVPVSTSSTPFATLS